MTPDRFHPEVASQTPIPTLRDIVGALFRNWRAVVAAFVCLAGVFALSGIWMPRYEAQMKILVQRQRVDNLITPAADSQAQLVDDQISEEDLNSEVELLGDEDLLRAVVLSVGLERGREPAKISAAVRRLRKALNIEAIHKTHMISVRYSSSDPQQSEKVLKALAAAYLAKHKEVDHPPGEVSFFEQQTSLFHQSLERAQQELVDFSKKTGIVSAQAERDSALDRSNEFAFDASKSAAEAAALQTRVDVMQSQIKDMQPRITTAERTSDNPQLLEHLKSTLLDLQLKRTDLLTRYQSAYPPVVEVEKQIAATQDAIRKEGSNPLRDETSDRNPDYEAVRSELLKAESDLGGLRSQQKMEESLAAEYRNSAQQLERSGIVQQNLLNGVKEQEDSYLLYLSKREEATISNALDQRGILNVAIAQPPFVPALPAHSPVSVALLGFFLCCTGSLGVGFAADALSSSFRTPAELAGYLGTPVLAALPAATRKR